VSLSDEQIVERLRMCVAEAGYDPEDVYLSSTDGPVIVQLENGVPRVPKDVGDRAWLLVIGEEPDQRVGMPPKA